MDLVVMLPHWIPEDDLILKNAVEAGASLESLAKGAVRFSRRYSITELRDRWRSLLYDSDVSREASASMANLEIGMYSGSGIREGFGEGGGKRKLQSLRNQYYEMRKRLCRQVFDNFDMALHDEMCIEKNPVGLMGVGMRRIDSAMSLVQGGLDKDVNNLLVNNLVDYGNYPRVEEEGSSHSMSEVPLWKTIEDVYVPAMPVQVNLENKSHGFEARIMLPHGLKGKCGNGAVNAPAAMLGEDATHISDSLLNLANDDEFVFMNIDGKDARAMDKTCYENVDSLLLSSPCDIQGGDAPDIHESHKLDSETKLATPGRSSAAGLEFVADSFGSSNGDHHFVSDPGNDVPSTAAAQSPHPERTDELMVCILNTEDPDIPCNDSTNLSDEASHSVTLKSQPTIKEVGYSDSLINNQRKNEPDGSLKGEDIPSHSLAASQTVRSGLVPDINSSYPPVGVALKTESPVRNTISAVSRQNNYVIVNVNPSHSRLVHATMMPSSDGHLKQEEIDAPGLAEVYAHPKAEEHKALTKSEAKSLSLDQEGGDDDNNDDDDNDNDIPYFSDVETMILEMDLFPSPADQDINASREVLRHQHAETKRTLMRLEQSALSGTRRTIASRGALAVLYGRNLKQYIKKREVILGRSTDDVQVDIDLGREGLANKISRRQALIRMEANGSFIIKNLGKSSIFLNGKEVATGQLRGLSDSNLIEIRGMSLIFEILNKCVRRLLENENGKGES
ncbi:uncharacterized protein LOC133301618 [Gastrolobium bilobum]|uniref:uncharacterized protein LOC133301618 n=1 Tax=Gastrolobium bilobum TaxID=150636 RepID=UPI002AB0B07A|nr:uncharacterized protein LOC133301618 [Gastrolobium bilobum]